MKTAAVFLLLLLPVIGCASTVEEGEDRAVDVEVETDTTEPRPAQSALSVTCACSYGYRWCHNCDSCGWYKTTQTC